MNTLAELINKLDKVTYTSVDGKTLSGLVGGQNLSVSIYLKMSETSHGLSKLPIQAVFHVRINDTHVYTWGSDSNDENSEMVTWFVKKSGVVNTLVYEKEGLQHVQAKSLFASI